MSSTEATRAADFHAARARELLELVDAQETELARIREEDADRHLQLAATGALGRLSRDRVYSVELATAHALAAIATSLDDVLGERGLDDVLVDAGRRLLELWRTGE